MSGLHSNPALTRNHREEDFREIMVDNVIYNQIMMGMTTAVAWKTEVTSESSAVE